MAQVETSVPLKPLSVAGRALTTEETHVVRSPWNGAPIAAVSTVGARETRAAIDAAAEAMATPLPAFERAEILDVLAQGPRSVEEIANEIDQSVANTSRHLRLMAQAGLLRSERRGTQILYRHSSDRVQCPIPLAVSRDRNSINGCSPSGASTSPRG